MKDKIMVQDLKSVTHICLLGDDPTANLTPLVDSDIPSHGLIIVYQRHQKTELEFLSQIAKTRGHEVENWLLPTTHSTEQIKLSFMQLFEKKSSLDETGNKQQLWLNASNGARHQVLSAYEVARSYQVPIFVVEPKHDALCWLYPEEWPMTPIKDTIKLDEFFQVNGCELVSQKNQQGISKSLIALGKRWLAKSDKLHSGLAKLNYLAVIAKGKRFSSKQDQAMLKDESLQWLLDELHRDELIEIDGKNVHFINSEIRFFCNGGWLEETTFGYIRGLNSELKTIQDDGHSVEIERQVGDKTVSNELDVVALVNNKLHVIECKTKKFERGDGNNTLYKLDSLAETLGGIKAKAALVTFFPIREAEQRRAIELEIEIFSFTDLPRLKQRLKEWLSKE